MQLSIVECKSYLIELMYEWFLEKQDDRIADLVFCFRLFLSPQEFLHIFENEYPCAEEYVIILLLTFNLILNTNNYLVEKTSCCSL